MRNELPDEWVNAAKLDIEDEEVVEVFDRLNDRWLRFFRKFDLYRDLVVDDEWYEGYEGKAYWPQRCPDKIEQLRVDIENSMLTRGLWKPMKSKVGMNVASGDGDSSSGGTF